MGNKLLDMSETIRKLANSSSFASLQDKVNSLKENYAVSTLTLLCNYLIFYVICRKLYMNHIFTHYASDRFYEVLFSSIT